MSIVLPVARVAPAWPPRASERGVGALPPWVVFPLTMPFGLAGGSVAVTLVFFLSQRGVGTTQIGSFLFVSFIPQTVKFLYAPLIDTTLGPRRWHTIGTVATALSMVAFAIVPPVPGSLALLTAIGFVSTFAATLVITPTDVIMAYDVAAHRKGHAAGWSTAANLGGGALGGGLALWLATHGLAGWVPAVAIAGLCLCCAPFVLLVATREPFAAHAGWVDQQRALVRDVWTMLRSRLGVLTALLAILPIGTGAMQNLFPAIARDWHAGADEVALVSGGAAGVVQIAGALLGGLLCDRFDRRWVYCASGGVVALTSVAMALGPRTPAAFVLLCLVYVFWLGISYTAFTAAVLEAIGKGAAASKYTVLICASNAAIFAQGYLDGWVHDRFSLTGMLYLEAGLAIVAIAIYALAAALHGRVAQAQP